MSEAVVTPGSAEAKERFDWTFNGRVVVLDNGPLFALSSGFKQYMDLNTFAVVSFDPANRLADKPELLDIEEFQLVNNIVTGNGNPVTFYACLNNDLSATLEPLPQTSTMAASGIVDSQVLTQLNIPSIRLNDVDGMQSLDLVMLDALHDNVSILEHGNERITEALMIDVQIPLQPTHKNQSDFCQISYWMAQNGFRFLRFQSFKQETKIPEEMPLEMHISSEMMTARALFMPSSVRLESLSSNQLMKLSFILHTIYKLYDMAYYVLNKADPVQAKQYLIAEGIIWPVDEDEVEFTLTEEYSPDIWVV